MIETEMKTPTIPKILFLALAIFCLTPWASSGTALFAGVLLAVTAGNPWAERTKGLTSRLLSLAVVGLGAGMNLAVVARVGLHGIGYTVLTIALAFLCGLALGRLLRTPQETSLLVTVGTAICGGSAIAAVAPVVRAKPHEISVALGVVFLLNAVALFVFPAVGRALSLDEAQFGLWSALAIHDTSSVVGASLQYGPRALEVGTTVKLARALWIVPVTFGIGWLFARRPGAAGGEKAKMKIPWFILGFLLMAAVMTWVPELRPAGHVIETAAKRLLILTLFLIGTNLSREALKSVGFRPLVQGLALWLIMGSTTLPAIAQGWIREG